MYVCVREQTRNLLRVWKVWKILFRLASFLYKHICVEIIPYNSTTAEYSTTTTLVLQLQQQQQLLVIFIYFFFFLVRLDMHQLSNLT